MVNTELLDCAIDRKGLKRGFLALKLHIDRSTFWKKATNQAEFLASEISTLSKLLDLSTEEKDVIFFNEEFTDSKQEGA